MESQHLRNIVAGKPVDTIDGRTSEIIDPVTEQVIALAPVSSAADVDAAVRAAAEAFKTWRRTTPAERQRALLKLADAVEARAEEFAAVESSNTGKPLGLTQSEELVPVVDQLRFFAGAARILDGRASAEYMAGHTSTIRREPIGVCAQVTPWNYPLLMAVWKIAPALAAGNTAVLKPSDTTPMSTILLAEVAQEFLPAGVFNVVCGDRNTGRALVEHHIPAMASITGSVRAGMEVAASAAKDVKRVHLELGGKAPCVVFDDADIAAAVEGISVAGYFNAGQDCTAATRVLVQESVYDELVGRVAARAASVRLGDPLLAETEMGPVAFAEHRETVESYISVGREDGATLLAGGGRPSQPELASGFFVEPTLFGDVRNDMRLAREEVFGPVAAAIRFSSEEEALRLANDTAFGLAAGIWTRDLQRAHRMARGIRAGTVWVNSYRAVGPMAPFGGFKASGLGRENGLEALQQYTELKTVWIELDGATRDPFNLA